MNKKIISCILALLCLITCVPVAGSAQAQEITVSSASAAPGTKVNLYVSISGNPGINTFTLGFDYDTSRLSLTGVSLVSALTGQFAYKKKAVWFSDTDTKYDGNILTLSFDVLADAPAGDARVAVTYNRGDISNYAEEDVDFTLVAGKVSVAKQQSGQGVISVGTASGKPSSQVRIPVSVDVNPGINTFTFGFEYDATRLSLENAELAGGLAGQFAYKKKAVWFNDSDTDFTGNVLILTFNVLADAPAGDAAVTVTFQPGDISNYNEEDVDFTVRAGKITVEAPSAENKPGIIVSSAEIKAGRDFVVSVDLDNNTGMAGLALSLDYDKNVFTLKEVKRGNLFSGFTAGINYVWDEGENVTENGTLAQFTFTAAENAAPGEYAIKAIVRSCTDEDYNTLTVNVTNGTVTVKDFIYGDANEDDTVDIKDVVALRKYIAEFDYATNTSSVKVGDGADANADGTVDIKDVVLLRKYIANYDYATNTSTEVLGPR